jgi:hypothetical protein
MKAKKERLTPRPTSQQQAKGNQKLTEEQTIFWYLKDNVATASMISEATGVKQKNICRYKRDLEKADMLWEVEKRDCEITGCKAWYLTTNPDKAPKNTFVQGSLFAEGGAR